MRAQARTPDLRKLVVDWQGPLYNLAYRMLGNHADAQDATQAVFERILRGIGAYDPRRPLRPWIYRLATNVVLNRIRAARTRRGKEAALRHERLHSEEDAVERREREALVQAQLAELPEDARALLVLHFYNGLPKKEVAEVLGLPRTTVQARLGRALRALQANLERNGHAALACAAVPVMREVRPVSVPRTLTQALLSRVPAAAAGLAEATGLGMGALLMGKKLLVGALVVFALGLAGGYFAWHAADPDPEIARLEAENRRLRDVLAAREAPAPVLASALEKERHGEGDTAGGGAVAAGPAAHSKAAEKTTTAAAKGSGIDWDRFADLFADSVELVAGTRDMNSLPPEKRTRMVTLLTEYMRIATAARARSDQPFFDRTILTEYVEAVFGNSLGLSETARERLRRRTADVLAETLGELDPRRGHPLRILRARRRMVRGITAAVEEQVDPEMRDRFESVRTIARLMMSGDHEVVGIGIRDETRRDHQVERILELWKRTFGLDESQLATVRPAAERLLQDGADALRSRGLDREDAAPTAAEQADLDEAYATSQLRAESSFQRLLSESQRQAVARSLPVLITFYWGEGERREVSSSGGI